MPQPTTWTALAISRDCGTGVGPPRQRGNSRALKAAGLWISGRGSPALTSVGMSPDVPHNRTLAEAFFKIAEMETLRSSSWPKIVAPFQLKFIQGPNQGIGRLRNAIPYFLGFRSRFFPEHLSGTSCHSTVARAGQARPRVREVISEPFTEQKPRRLLAPTLLLLRLCFGSRRLGRGVFWF